MGAYDTPTLCRSCSRNVPVDGTGICADCRGEVSRVEIMRLENKAWLERGREEQRRRDELEAQRKTIFPFREYVYVARLPYEDGGPIKIGYSGTSVKRRIKAQWLELLFVVNANEGRKVEKALHRLYAKQRIYRTEFFWIGTHDLERAKMLVEIEGIPLKVVTHGVHLAVYLP